MSYEPGYIPPVPVQPAASPTSTLALISLISGILGLFIFPLIGSIIALITGPMAKKEIRESRGALGGEGLATAGIVLGWVGIGLAILGMCVVAFFILVPILVIFFSAIAGGVFSGWAPLPAWL
jgi:hypothetical protein